MKLLIKEIKEFTLTLNQDEASWLKNYMQNSYKQDGQAKETVLDRKMREVFWNLLSEKKEGEANGETED